MPYLTDLADVLRNAGLPVVEHDGWKTRGHGPMTEVRTIVCHHTAGPKVGDLPSLRVVRDGRPGLDGPLSQLMVSRSGVWHVIAAGKCWHAGVVKDPTYGNAYAVGIEAEATGVDPWPPVQYASYVKGARALANRYKVPYARVLGHKEVCDPTGRKGDPNFDMGDFRAELEVKPDLVQPAVRQDTSRPRFPLPEGHYFGVESGDPYCHSGYWARDKTHIETLQAQFRARGYDIKPDGNYGPRTEHIVKVFQQRVGFKPSGRCGPGIWKLAWTAPLGVNK